MKPLSLSVLLLLSALTAQAGVVMVDGTVYDTGKGAYSWDSTVKERQDSNHCWAASAANAIQHWQDEYLETVVEDPEQRASIPNGYAETDYTLPSGTRYLEVYNAISNKFTDAPLNQALAADWYFSGKTTEVENGAALVGVEQSGGYMKDSGVMGILLDTEQFLPVLITAMSYRGYAVFLGIAPQDGDGGHAITCWGYETDSTGQYLTALYVTDSDDKMFGTRRLEFGVLDGQYVLYSPYDASYYSDTIYVITSAGMLGMVDEEGKIDMGDRELRGNNRLDSLPQNGKIYGTVDMAGNRLSSPDGISTEAGSIFASSGQAALTLGGGAERAAGDGLTLKAGSMLVFQDTQVSVSGFEGNGLRVGCEAYFMEGAVSITGNGGAGIAVQGTETDPMAFLQIIDNDTVEISGNEGSGIYVAGAYTVHEYALGVYQINRACTEAEVVWNDVVTISGNTAALGGGAYVAGDLALSGNEALYITGNKAGQGSAIYADKTVFDIPGLSRFTVDPTVEIAYNTRVEISGNEITGDTAGGAVLYNGGSGSSMQIVGNGSVTFSGNKAQYDIYNEGELSLVANEGQSITFEHGVKNSSTGTATLGAGEAGTYAFSDGGSGVSLTLAGATIGKNGGMMWEDTTLTLSEVAFAGDVTIDLGFYADMNRLDLASVSFAADSNVSFILDLGSEAGGFMLMTATQEDSLTEVKVTLKDYIAGDISALDGVNLSLTVTGTLADDAMLVIDPGGFGLASVSVPDCKYKTTADGKIYYGAPEPTSATLSLLALAALASRRRRR